MKPNILFITTDQQRWDHLGLAGLTGIPTPNLDRLGREGIHLPRAYCAAPTCTPSRVSLLTGRYPSSHGAWSIGVTADPFPQPTIPALLQQAGYRTGMIGKTHFVARKHEDLQIFGKPNPSSQEIANFDGPCCGFDFVRGSSGHTINQRPKQHYKVFLEQAGVDYRPWFPQLSANYDHHYCGAWDIPVEYHDTTWVAKETRGFIESQAAGAAPWFCWASFQDPHEPFVCPQEWWDKVDTDKIKLLPSARPDEFADKPALYGRLQTLKDPHYDDGFGLPCLSRSRRWDEQAPAAMRATLGMVGMIDNAVGQLIASLERTGQLANTVIVFTSDHGELHGHHGFWGKGVLPYEDSQRVPLLIWGQGLVKPNGTHPALVSLIDLPKTFLDLAGAPIAQGIQGRSLLPLVRGETDHINDAVLIEDRATARFYQQTMVTRDHKLVVYHDCDDGELYDLASDPDQYVNLWAKPEHSQLRSKLLLQLVGHQMRREGHRHARTRFA